MKQNAYPARVSAFVKFDSSTGTLYTRVYSAMYPARVCVRIQLRIQPGYVKSRTRVILVRIGTVHRFEYRRRHLVDA